MYTIIDESSDAEYLALPQAKIIREAFKVAFNSGVYEKVSEKINRRVKVDKQYYRLIFTNEVYANPKFGGPWILVCKMNRNSKNLLETFHSEDDAIITIIKTCVIVDLCSSLVNLLVIKMNNYDPYKIL